VTACFLQNEPTSPVIQLFKPLWGASIAKASVNSANIEMVFHFKKLYTWDPKPGELTMTRVIFNES